MLADPLLLLILAAVTVGAAAVHSAIGFGSGPLMVPVLLLAFDPPVAVLSAVVIGMVVNLLQLSAERRRPRVHVGRLLPLWLGAVPGCVIGALLVEDISTTALAVMVAGVLLLIAAGLFASPSTVIPTPPPAMAGVGAVAGASAALTGIFGPLLSVVLVAAGERADELRDGVGASFLVVGAMTVVASLSATSDWTAVSVAGMLALPAAAGYVLGRRGARLLDPAGQRRAVLAAVVTGAVVALARAAA